MFNDCKTLVDLITFQKAIADELSSKNGIKIFRTKDVPNPNVTKPNVNEAEVKKKNKKETRG